MDLKLRLTEDEICPRCGRSFHCSKSGKCWCYAVQVPEDVQDEIGHLYDRCLCPDCLNELAQRNKIKE